jgi:hypothetical protein
MNNPLFDIKAVQTGTVATKLKSEPEREPKQMVSAPQHCKIGSHLSPTVLKQYE